MKRMHEYSAIEWAKLYPEERYVIKKAADDAATAGRSGAIPVRAADGRGVVWIDAITKKPVAPSAARRIGG